MSLSPAAAPPRTRADSTGLPAAMRGLRSLIKTRIVLMVMVAAALGYWAAAGSFQPVGTLAAALAGTALASAGAGVLNNVLERHVDARMVRTRERALPQGSVAPSAAAWFGAALTAGGAGLLAWRAGLEPALLSLLAAALYLFVYTPLKPRTWLNTPLGAIPGAVPPLIGGAAGVWYAAGAMAAGAAYLAAGIRFARRLDTPGSRLLLRVSVLYVPAMLLLSIADRFLPSM